MKRLLIGSLIIISCFILSSEEEIRPYRLINANTLLIQKINDEYITLLTGDVHFFYGETEFFCDSAEIYEQQKITRMIDNVLVVEDTLNLIAEFVEYNRMNETLYLRDSVIVKETHIDSTYTEFSADEVFYFRIPREFSAYQSVKMYDSREKLFGSCEEMKYFIETGYGYLIKDPVLNLDAEDYLSISAEKIEYFNDFKKVVANFNVFVEARDFTMKSDFLLYFSEEEKAIFLGNPRFFSDFADAKAEEIQLFFKEKNIEKAVLRDSCLVYFRENRQDEKINWVLSDFMDIGFLEGNIDLFLARGQVNSYVVQEKSENKDFLINETSGDELKATFIDNDINKIIISNRVSGKYKFEKK